MDTGRINEAAERLAGLAWAQLWQVTLVALAVAIMARLVGRRRPHLAYVLWMLVIVKALTPPLLASRAGVFSWMQRTTAPAAVAAAPEAVVTAVAPAPASIAQYQLPRPTFDEETLDGPTDAPAETPAPVARRWYAELSPVQALLGIWALGAAALALYAVGKWFAYRRRWHSQAVAAPDNLAGRVAALAERLKLRPAVRRRLRILVSRGAGSPAVFGVWRPTLLLPADLFAAKQSEAVSGSDNVAVHSATVADESHIDTILAHELVHVRRGDPAVAVVQLAAQLVWWFHPLIWWANREARRERERACDEEVITGLRCRPADYARALLDVLERQTRRQPAFAVPGVGMFGVTARRLEHLLSGQAHFRHRTPRWYYALACAALAIILPGAGLQIAAAPPAATASTPASDKSVPDAKAAAVDEAPIDITEMRPGGAYREAGPTIIFTEHVILWDKRIVSWEQMLLRFRQMRSDGPIHPHFLFTHGAFKSGVEDRVHKKFFEVYKELFEPAGMSMGSMMWRTSQRLDRIRTDEDLRPDPQRARSGVVLMPDGKPAAGAQVAIVPKKDPSGVTLWGKKFRDDYQEDWVPSDDEGRFTVYPDSDEYVLIVLHDSGADIHPVPAANERTTIQLEPWARVVFTSTGGVKDQKGDIRIRPNGIEPDDLEFQVYEVEVKDRSLSVPVPAGESVISRSLKMADGSAIGLPVEKFELAAGQERAVAVKAPTPADRAKADEFRAFLRKQREDAKDNDAPEAAPAAGAKSPAADEAKPVQAAEPKKPGAADEKQTGTQTGEVTGKFVANEVEPAGPQPAAAGAEQPQYGLQLVFPADGAQPVDEAEKDGPTPAANATDVAASPAARKLLELGARVYSRSPKSGLGISIADGWRGTDADVTLVNEVPQVEEMSIELTRVSPETLGQLKLARPLQTLIMWPVTDEGLLKTRSLPAARFVSISDAALTPRGCAQLADLLGNVESLSIVCRRPRQQMLRELTALEKKAGADAVFEVDEEARVDADAITNGANAKIDEKRSAPKPPAYVTDAGLSELVRLKNLKKLNLMYAGITDAGLAKVAQLPRLDSLSLDGCPGVTGTGLAALEPLAGLRRLTIVNIPLSGAGMQAVGKLSQLQNLFLAPANYKPEDFAPLAGLANLRTLSVGNNWSLQDGPLRLATGDAVLKVAGRLPKLERVSLSALKVTDEGLEDLAGATSLRQLHLSPIVVTDQTLVALSKLAQLQWLSLDGTPEMIEGTSELTDAGLAQLAALTRLRELSMPGRGVTDQGLASLAKLTELRRLALRESSVTGSGLSALSGLAKLQVLELPQSAVDDDGCKNLPALPALTTLNLDNATITDAALDSIAQLKNLANLWLQGTKVTGAGYAKLAGLTKLQQLTASGWNVSEEQFAAIMKAHPGLQVHGRDWPGQKQQQGVQLVVSDGGISADTTESFITLDLPPDLPVREEKKEDGKDAQPKPAEPKKEDSTRAAATAASDLPAALARLRELGLEFAPQDPVAAAKELQSVGLNRGWKGTAEDLRPLNDVPSIKQLYALLDQVDPAVLDALAPRKPIGTVILQQVSDQKLAKMKSMPQARQLVVDQCELGDAGGRRLAELAPHTTILQLSGLFRQRGDNTPPAGITDEGLRHIATMRELQTLQLLVLGVSDAGIAHLAALDKLAMLVISECPNVHGAGLTKLSEIPTFKQFTLRTPVDAAGFEAVAGLTQLDSLWLLADDARPEDLARLAALKNLRSLAVWSERMQGNNGQPKEVDPETRELQRQQGDALFTAAGQLPELRSLVANGFRPDAAGLAALAGAPRLQSLYANPIEIDDRSLSEIARLQTLRWLNLTGTGEPTAAGLAKLAELSRLRELMLSGTTLTDDALGALAPLGSLESLMLPGSKITGTGLPALTGLKKLKALGLGNSLFDDQGAQVVAVLPALESLYLSGSRITDAGLPALTKSASLKTLGLADTAVTAQGLAQLSDLKTLRKLDVQGLKADKQELAALRAALPGVNIDGSNQWVMFQAAKFEVDDDEPQGTSGPVNGTVEPMEE